MGRGGESSGTAATSAPEFLASNPQFAPFLEADFDAGEFASKALAGAHITAQAQTEQLQDGLRSLDEALRGEVLARHDELVGQAERLTATEAAFGASSLAVGALQAALRRVRAEILDPYQQVKAKTRQLAALHETVVLLRAALLRLKLTAKLRAALADPTVGASALDLAKAAKLAADVEALGRDADFSGLAAVEADDDFLRSAGQQIRSHAEELLQRGMEALSQAEVGSALQVYFNLGELKAAVDGLLEGQVAAVERALSTALDPRKLNQAAGGLLSGPAGRAAAVPAAKRQEVLWERLGEALAALAAAALAAWHVQRVLAKKRDPLSHALFADAVAPPGVPSPVQAFWEKLNAAAGEAFAGAAHPSRGGFVREALLAGFPRLAASLEETLAKLQRDTNVKGAAPAVDEAQAEALLAAAAPFRDAYLASALSRLSDAVGAAFPGGSRPLPSTADLQKCIGRMHEELKAVSQAGRLATKTAAGVGTSLQLLAERAQYMAAGGAEARSIAGPATAAVARNAALAGHLAEVARSLRALLPRVPPGAAAALERPLEAVQGAAVEVILPHFRAMVDAAEAALLKLHGQRWDPETPPGQDSSGALRASRYMADLAHLLAHCRTEYLSTYGPAPGGGGGGGVAAPLVECFAARLLTLFTRHAALLRPLSQSGRLQLAKDMAELEEAIGSALVPAGTLGRPFRAFRALRPLLFAETAELATPDCAVLTAVPAVAAAHHLLSRGPPSLESPMSRSGLTPAQYSAWLDQHSTAEALTSIRAAVEASPPAARQADVVQLVLRLCGGAS